MYVCKSLQHAKENKSLKFCSVEPQKGNLLLHVQSGPYASFSMGEFNYIFIKVLSGSMCTKMIVINMGEVNYILIIQFKEYLEGQINSKK